MQRFISGKVLLQRSQFTCPLGLFSMISLLLALSLWIAVSLFSLSSMVHPVAAESNATLVVMRYVSGISNWGPASATGIGKVWRTDGEIMLTVDGLPHLPAWQEYRLWLTNQKTGALVPVGRFNTDSTGHGGLDTLLYNVVSPAYNLLVVTVQSVRDPQTQPGARRALAGYIPGSAQLGPPPTTAPLTLVTAPQAQIGQVHTGHKVSSTSTADQPTAVGRSAGLAALASSDMPLATSVPPPLPTSLPQTGLARSSVDESPAAVVTVWPRWVWGAVIVGILGLVEMSRFVRRQRRYVSHITERES